jgi:hypothetical protein
MVMDYKLSAKKVVLFPLNLKRPKMTQSNHNKKKEESRKKEEKLIQSNPVLTSLLWVVVYENREILVHVKGNTQIFWSSRVEVSYKAQQDQNGCQDFIRGAAHRFENHNQVDAAFCQKV